MCESAYCVQIEPKGYLHINTVEDMYYENRLTQLLRLRSPGICKLENQQCISVHAQRLENQELQCLRTEDGCPSSRRERENLSFTPQRIE